jgi:hypothetical protein
MADMCAVNSKVLDFALNGRKGKKPKTVQASTFRALNAIGFRDIAAVQKASGRKVDSNAARLQIQSLQGGASTRLHPGPARPTPRSIASSRAAS